MVAEGDIRAAISTARAPRSKVTTPSHSRDVPLKPRRSVARALSIVWNGQPRSRIKHAEPYTALTTAQCATLRGSSGSHTSEHRLTHAHWRGAALRPRYDVRWFDTSGRSDSQHPHGLACVFQPPPCNDAMPQMHFPVRYARASGATAPGRPGQLEHATSRGARAAGISGRTTCRSMPGTWPMRFIARARPRRACT